MRDARVLVEWNALAIATGNDVDEFRGPRGHRAMALMHLAVHDALNAIMPVYEQRARVYTVLAVFADPGRPLNAAQLERVIDPNRAGRRNPPKS